MDSDVDSRLFLLYPPVGLIAMSNEYYLNLQ